jgi:hypothetical protein
MGYEDHGAGRAISYTPLPHVLLLPDFRWSQPTGGGAGGMQITAK